VYFVQDNFPEESADVALERVEGGFGFTPDKHFFAIRNLVPGLRGLAILDNDGKARADRDAGGAPHGVLATLRGRELLHLA
jgi:hypothetical protein